MILELIKTISTDIFWESSDLSTFEMVRKKLRGLIKFLYDGAPKKNTIYTILSDTVLQTKEGDILDPGYDFEDYKLKVNRYIEEHHDHLAIYKLRNNIPLTKADYQVLSDILTKQLGNEEDYKREYQDLPFGLLVRKIAKLDHEAAMKVFSEFINDQSLNQQQIVFVDKIIKYIVQNGYMENTKVLMSAPFDKPQSFMKIFNRERQKKIIQLIEKVKENAIEVS